MADGTMHSTVEQSETREEQAVRNDAAREPVKHPEGVAPSAEAGKPNEQRDNKDTDLPEHIGKRRRALNAFDRFTDSVRRVTPAGLINNGSRINFGLKAIADSMGIASGLGIVFHPNFRMDPARRSWSRVAANVPTFATLIPGIIYKEQPLSEEQIESYKQMSSMEYVGTKVKEAFHPKDHIVETVALATVANGVLTSVSGIGQSNFKNFNAFSAGSWKKISMEFIMGAFTTVAGATLGLIPERQRAWQVSTAAFTWRIPFKATHAYTALKHGYPHANPPVPKGDWFQMSNFVLQQTANIFGFFFAGIKKTEDGDIIRIGKDEATIDLDDEKIRGYNYKPGKEEHKNATPGAKVQVEHSVKAMPERVQAQAVAEHGLPSAS